MAACLNINDNQDGGVTSKTSKCVDRLDGSNKIEANHQFCVKPPNEMVRKSPHNSMGLDNTGKYIGAAFQYLGAIVTDRYSICSKECGIAGCAGQMYVQETNAKCSPDSHRDCTVNKYIFKDYSTFKNVLSGRSKNESDGQLAATIADLARPITDNQILKAIKENPVPLCKAVRLKCSVLKVGANDSTEYYGRYSDGGRNMHGDTPEHNMIENTGKVWISYSDLMGDGGLYARGLVIDDSGIVQDEDPGMAEKLKTSEEADPTEEIGPSTGAVGFTNIAGSALKLEGFNSERSKAFESIKTQQPSVHPGFLKNSEISKSFDTFSNYNTSNDNDDNLIHEKIYFILLSLFLSYIIYKMLYNKK